MLKSGLTSVTFRSLPPKAIIDLVVQASLDAIEWGGDVHVPHGDIGRAGEIREMTEESGLITSSYGSYYRVCAGRDSSRAAGVMITEANPPIEGVLETAVELKVPTVRLWAGDRGSAGVGEYRVRVGHA